MTLAINSVSSPKAHTPVFRGKDAVCPVFREKDAVCIEARASKTTTSIKPVQSRPFQYQLADMQIAAQLLRHQSSSPAASARDVALAYRQGAMVMTASGSGIQV